MTDARTATELTEVLVIPDNTVRQRRVATELVEVLFPVGRFFVTTVGAPSVQAQIKGPDGTWRSMRPVS